MEYRLIRSNRKSIAIQVTRDGVLVRAPLRMPLSAINGFVQSNRAWIEKAVAKCPVSTPVPSFTQTELDALTRQARQDIPQRVARWAAVLGVSYGRIALRYQKTRWGSCSSKKNLNFNCLLMLVPEDVRDYVVVHELCHLREMNHSSRFWALVENAVPQYKQHRQWLRTHGKALIDRL